MSTKNPGSGPQGASARTAYLVLGMHRSGTSAVTQLLALAGARLPENVMPGDEHNAKGYFEPWKVAILNDGRLRAAGSAWDDVFAFPFRPLEGDAEAQWLSRARTLFTEEFGETRHPLLKDPRATVLLPLWLTVLSELEVGARCVIPVRHPLAVAGSLSRRDGFAAEKSVLLWSAYMLAAEAYSRDLPRAFVGYDNLLRDWRGEVARIEAAHGAPLPRLTERAAGAIDKFLSPELRHNEAQGDLAALGWAGEMAATIQAWFEAAAAGQAPDGAVLDAAAEALARRARDVGALVSPLTRDLDVARAELHDMRQRLVHERDGLERDIKQLRSELEALRRERRAAEGRLDAILRLN
ncbi:MAG: hypothetical protein JWQ46_1566 [Phenylobacterium sp.]|nr:hypothetical protein [Phenylobacterium sp.]